jgi:hypothetical protein
MSQAPERTGLTKATNDPRRADDRRQSTESTDGPWPGERRHADRRSGTPGTAADRSRAARAVPGKPSRTRNGLG